MCYRITGRACESGPTYVWQVTCNREDWIFTSWKLSPNDHPSPPRPLLPPLPEPPLVPGCSRRVGLARTTTRTAWQRAGLPTSMASDYRQAAEVQAEMSSTVMQPESKSRDDKTNRLTRKPRTSMSCHRHQESDRWQAQSISSPDRIESLGRL